MRDLLVRQAAPEDASTIVAGINAVCAEAIYFYTPRYVPTAQWEAALHRPHDVPDHLLLLAEAPGNIFLGSAHLFPADHYGRSSRIGELGIFVLQPYRSRGVGSRLMAEVAHSARGLGYTSVSLTVLSINLRAIHVYGKFGFTVTGRRRREYAFLGQCEELIMACDL